MVNGFLILLRNPRWVWPACLVLYVVLGPTQAPFYTPSLYDNARLLQIFVLSALSLGTLAIPSLRSGMLHAIAEAPKPIQLALLTFIVVALVSALRASLPMMALQEVALFILLCVLALSVAALAIENRKALDLALLAAFEASAVVFIVVFWMARVAAIHMSQAFEWESPFVTFANVRHFSQFQAYTLPLLVVPVASASLPARWRAVAFLVAAHWWALQFAVGTRAVWFAMGLAALFLGVILRREALAYLKWLGLSIAMGCLLHLLLTVIVLGDAPGLSEIGRRGFDTSNRVQLWNVALGMVRESPWFGVGPMHFSFSNFEWAAHPHNALLQIAAEYGLPATAIIVALVAYLLWRCVRWSKSAGSADDRILNHGLLAALLMGLADSLVSGNTLMPVAQMAVFVLIGWMIGRNAKLRATSELHITPSKVGGLVLAVLSLACAVAVSSGALHYYEYWDARQFRVPAGRSHPRYWEEGHWPAQKPKLVAAPKG